MGWYQRRVHGDTDSTAMVSSGAALAWLLVVAIALVAHGESEEIQTLRMEDDSVSLGESADMEEYTADSDAIGATSRLLSQADELIRAHEQKASTSGYLSTLAEAQKQCPASMLQVSGYLCPQQQQQQQRRTAAANTATEACDYHPGLAAKSWLKPYRKAVLDSSLRNIMHNGVRVDCNPASCDNPRVCGIPPCRGIPRTKNGIKTPDYWKAVTKKTCPAAKGCGAQTTTVSSDMPLKPKWAYLSMTQPATRVGTILTPAYTPGIVHCYPTFTKTDIGGYTGSWMWPGAGNCNPYQLMACTKGSIAHTSLQPQCDNSHRHSALLFVKRTWCIKGECDSSDCPARCYTSKLGRCLRFHKKVMPPYASNAAKQYSRKAYKELVAGRFSTKCTPEAARAARAMLAGN